MKINTTLLSYISKEISNGRPLWGLLRANEYLAADCPIRTALASKASVAIQARISNSEESIIYKLTLEGKKLSELSAEQQLTAHNIKESYTRPTKKYSFVAPILNNRREIRARRSSNG